MEVDDLQSFAVNFPSYLLQHEMARCFAERIGWQGGCNGFAMDCGGRDINEILDVLVISQCIS